MLVERRAGCLGLVLTWLLSAVALAVSAWIVPGVSVDSFGTALVAAAILGLVNAVVRPILVVLTLPVTVVTLGLFLLVVNAACIALAANVVGGFRVDGFLPAVLMVVVLTLVSSVVGSLFGGDNKKTDA
ncbi:MAG TPA: phage holin family protein [Myxococcota bacterium]